MRTVDSINQPARAAAILAHPLRPRILAAAQQPVSAAALARAFELPRQRINYHVRQLESHGLLRAVGRQRKGNMVEQQYVASAQSYALAADLLGAVAAQPEPDDPTSAVHLLGLCAQAQTELGDVVQSARQAGLRMRAFSIAETVHFANAQQRADFTRALSEAFYDVVARFSTQDGSPFRLLVGCYPAR